MKKYEFLFSFLFSISLIIWSNKAISSDLSSSDSGIQQVDRKISEHSSINENNSFKKSDPSVQITQKTTKTRSLIDTIVARVNGINIFLSDLTRPRIDKAGQPYLTRQDYDANNKEAIDTGLKSAIDQELLFQKAVERKLTPTDIDIEKQIVSFKAMQRLSHLTNEEFEKELAREGLTLDLYKMQLRQLMAIERLRHSEASDRLVITADEIEKYYHANREYMEGSFTFKIASFDSSLFTTLPKKMELLRRHDIIWDQFEPLQKSQIAQHLSFIFTMRKGEVSDPVRFNDAYQLVMLVDRQEARYKTLDEQAMSIEKILKEEKKQHYMHDFIQELHSQAIIVFF